MSSSKRAPSQATTIDLLPAEELLRDLLLECRQQLATPELEVWITGGWNEASYQQRALDLGIEFKKFNGFHSTKKNLDKSKKLETAEVYDGDCRTPETEFGTAEDDAFRRDATANALFFDLQNRKVADFTRRGLDDLEAGIMRTPLEPRQTFLDGPLRVLRLIRIGSKLGFTLDPEALSCIKEHEIHVALDEKDPARDFWALMESEKQKDMLWAMVVYAPLAGLDTKDHKLAVDEAINALKGTRQLYKLIESSLGNLESIRSTMELVIGSTPSRGTIGMMIRKWGVFWGLQVLFSALGEIVYLKPRPESPAPSQGEIDKVLQRHEALLSFAQKQRLNSVSSIRPILDGSAIKKALGVKQGGKLLARAIEVLLEWQLDHEEADEAAAEAWLLSQRDKLGLPIAESK
ncbi:poly(A) polymerase [Fusarium oxysporum]|nr:poly(A) polymerase [Fusarium oxysporum]